MQQNMTGSKDTKSRNPGNSSNLLNGFKTQDSVGAHQYLTFESNRANLLAGSAQGVNKNQRPASGAAQ
jgi:hypothetical protein